MMKMEWLRRPPTTSLTSVRGTDMPLSPLQGIKEPRAPVQSTKEPLTPF
jgi:hypothetical protein